MNSSLKRLLSLILGVMMIVGMMPVSVLANVIDLNNSDWNQQLQDIINGSDEANGTAGYPVGVYTTDGDVNRYQSYATLKEAISKAKPGDTFVLQSDLTIYTETIPSPMALRSRSI